MRFFYLVFILVLFSCTYNEHVPGSVECTMLDENPSYDLCIQQIFSESCVGCHQYGNPSGGLQLQGYDQIYEAVINGDVLNRINLEQNNPLLMPKGNKLSDLDIYLIEKWVSNGALND